MILGVSYRVNVLRDLFYLVFEKENPVYVVARAWSLDRPSASGSGDALSDAKECD